MTGLTLRRVTIAVLAVGVAAAVAAAIAGAVLAEVYRPHAPGVEPLLRSDAVRRSVRWQDRHQAATAVFLAASVVGLGLVLVARFRPSQAGGRRGGWTAIGTGAAAALALLTVLTRSLVEWQQLALRSVTVGGEDMAGYWFAAFDDEIVFILVDGTEVSQGDYVPAMLAHLGAPVVGAVVLAVAVTLLARRRPQARNGTSTT